MSKLFESTQVAVSIPFDNSTNGFTADNVQTAIEQARGIKTFSFNLHYVSGTGLNTAMNNGSFFRVNPGTFSSGSNSGYPACFPLQAPFNCKIYSIVLTFRSAAFDFNATLGPILFELETNTHTYNGKTVKNIALLQFGDFNNSSTGTSTFTYELFKTTAGTDGFSYVSGVEQITYGEMIGCRFVKPSSGDRRINSFRDIVMKINYEEA